MSILVTGTAGFIGSVVSRILLESGESVVGVDNINNSYNPLIKEWRLEQLKLWPNFEFYRTDISDYQGLSDLFSIYNSKNTNSFSGVINLGARAGVLQSVQDPWTYYNTNTIGTINLLELCKNFNVPKFVLASTSSLYGNDTDQPFNEESSTNRPLSPYAASKKAAETISYTYSYLENIDITVLRYFTVYGPAGRPDMVIYKFIKSIAEDQPLVIKGDGGERDFTYVDDIARGTIAALKPMDYEIINLGGDAPIKIVDIIPIMEDKIDKRATKSFYTRHPADVQATWADISKARNLLKWEPKTTIDQGIENTVKWYLDNQELAREI